MKKIRLTAEQFDALAGKTRLKVDLVKLMDSQVLRLLVVFRSSTAAAWLTSIYTPDAPFLHESESVV